MTTYITTVLPTAIPTPPTNFLYCGDNIKSLKELAANSIDSIVTDPPYGLSAHSPADIIAAMTAWASGKEYLVKKKGFMGKTWDSFVPGPELWKEALRVLKPGGHLLCFAGSRTDDLMGISLRLAGFEIRDKIMWIYGSGFPKSQDVAKFIDKNKGAERTVSLGVKPGHEGFANRGNMSSVGSFKGTLGGDGGFARPWMDDPDKVEQYHNKMAPAPPEAVKYEGYGTALKPAFEPIIVARKPLGEKTVAANVLKHGTGGINIDGCRVGAEGGTAKGSKPTGAGNGIYGAGLHGSCDILDIGKGRFPANIMHDGSPEVEEAFGTSARFFYSSKANKTDRAESKHPTVKPVSLMRYLVRLVTPPGGTVLDPFAGSGTTGQAAVEEGFSCILMELETAYQDDIERRFGLLKKAKPDTKLICVRPVPSKDSPTP